MWIEFINYLDLRMVGKESANAGIAPKFIDGQLKIDRGAITQLIMKTDLGEYRFNGAIQLKSFCQNNVADRHELQSVSGMGSFQLSDIMTYTPIFLTGTEDYSPEDTVISLSLSQKDPNNEISIPLRGKSIRSQFSIHSFTDAIGLFTKQPNGVLQIQGDLEYMLRGRRSVFSGFERGRLGLTYIQQNEDNAVLPIRYDASRKMIYQNGIPDPNNQLVQRFVNTFDLIRFARVSFDSRLALLTFDFRKTSTIWRLYLGNSYYYNNLVDTTVSSTTVDNEVRTVYKPNSFAHISSIYGLGLNMEYLQPQYSIFLDGFMFNMVSIINANDVVLDNGYLITDPFGRNKISTEGNNYNYTPFGRYNEVFWNDPWRGRFPFALCKLAAGTKLFLKEDKSQTIILRMQHYFGFYNEGRGSFWQLQVGYNYTFGVGKPIHAPAQN